MELRIDWTKMVFAVSARLWLSGALGLLTLMARVAVAQPSARSFADLQSILVTGDDVRVADSNRTTMVGAVVEARNCGSTDCGEGGNVDPGFYVFGAGIGARVGAVLDRSIQRFDTLFATPSPASVRRVSLVPILFSLGAMVLLCAVLEDGSGAESLEP
jgi:hypothetical protein